MEALIPWNEEFHILLSDVIFISRIGEGEKPCFRNRIYTKHDTLYDWVYGSTLRLIMGESGNDTYNKLRKIWSRIIYVYNQRISDIQRKSLDEHIQAFYQGIKRLYVTYEKENDINMTTNLYIILIEIEYSLKNKINLDNLDEKKDDIVV